MIASSDINSYNLTMLTIIWATDVTPLEPQHVLAL